MSEEGKPKSPAGNRKGATTFMPPETTGAMKRNPWHMSINELIEYKSTGIAPMLILDVEKIYTLAKSGVSIQNICGIFGLSHESFINNSAFLTAHRNGRGDMAARNRAAIAEEAANGSLQAMIHLDKLMGGDIEKQEITVRPGIPKEIEEADSELLKRILRDSKDSDE